MSSLTQCKSANDIMDTNNNFPPKKSYSLRPRGSRMSEEQTSSDPELPKPFRKKKQRSLPLSKYRRKTANTRERSRMREINEAFETLRRVIPQMTSREETGEKLTKISTLRLAMKYISALSGLLQDQYLESDGDSFLGDYSSLTSPDSQDGLPPLTPTLAVSGAPSPFVDSLGSSGDNFVDSFYLLEDAPLFMAEFS